MNFTRRNGSGSGSSAAATPFCKVCYDAGLSTDAYTSHFVKDQPGPNGNVVCPTLLAQKCLICGIPGHTSSYCREKSSASSAISSIGTRYAVATDEIRRTPLLPPLLLPQRTVPHIVYPPLNNNKYNKHNSEFPSLSSRHHDDDDEPPMLKRGVASPVHASPVHSPQKQFTKVKYNKKSNPFGDLRNDLDDNDKSDDDVVDIRRPQAPKKPLQEKTSSSSSSSWASIAAGNPATKQPQPQPQQLEQKRGRSRFSIVLPTAISNVAIGGGPLLLPPIVFKAKPKSNTDSEKKQEKKLWGDSDSEDDEEFLKRGVQN